MAKKINPADIAQSIIPDMGEIGKTVSQKTTVKLGTSAVVSGWGAAAKDVKADKLTYHNKPNTNDWNLKDLAWYVKNRYSEKYGLALSIPIAAGFDALNKIKFAMFKKAGKEVSHGLVKDYIDFVFDRHADEIIRAEGCLTIHKFTKPKLILEFMDKVILPQPTPVIPIPQSVEVSEDSNDLTIDDLTTAYRINSQYMVTNYGIVIPVNYLMAVKGKSFDDAISYVQGAMVKLSAKGPQDMQQAIESTNKYQPYPKWLKFTDVSKIVKMTISICDDNPVFQVFKENK